MPGAFHKSAYYLVERNIKEQWPPILTEHLCYEPEQQSMNMSMSPLLTAGRSNAQEVYSM